MKVYLLIAVGSALGGTARHWLTGLITTRALMTLFPWGTFAVNLIGSFLIGLIAALPQARLSDDARHFLAVGLMGGFTTFSAFSLQSFSLLQAGKIGLSAAYMLGSVAFCVAGCAVGWWAGRQIG